MILDTLAASGRHEGLSPRFAAAFRWLRSADESRLSDGRTPLEGDELYVLVQRGLTKPLEQTKWEAHRRYADIQYVCRGTEAMFWQSLDRTRPGAYQDEKDFLPLETETWQELSVGAGVFAVFFPEDAHRPGILIPGAEPVVKLVMKVLL